MQRATAMYAAHGNLQQRQTLFFAALVPKSFVVRQVACPKVGACLQTRCGLSAISLLRQSTRRSGKHVNTCLAAAETAAVSQEAAPNPGTGNSSMPGGQPTAAPAPGSGPGFNQTKASAGSVAHGSSSGSNSVPLPNSTAATAAASMGTPGAASGPPGAPPAAPFSLKPVYVLIFTLLFLGGLLFASMSLQLTSDMGFRDALTKVIRRIFRSIAFRQLVVITTCILMVRFALNNVLRFLARWSSSPVQWDKSKLYYVMKEVYSPLELLLFIAGCCTIADSFVPQLVNVPKATVNHVVRAVLSMSFVMGASVVVYNLKSRFCKEQAWNCEMQGDVTSQRRWEAYDKLGTFAIYVFGTILVIQALGLEVRSVLAIGGIGGLAIGLAGREICENLLNGFLLMTTMPFEVGEEVMFRPKANEMIEGIVVDVGWYRTLIRSFEREMYVIPNAVFSKNTVLNVTRKMREWRFYEFLCVRVQDVHKVNAIIQDIRRIVRNDARIMNKLHRRVFLDKISMEDVKIYISFYVEASNRDAFMAVKQDLLLAFVDCVERNGAKLATPRTVFEMDTLDAETLMPRMTSLGLLPAPGGSSGMGGYGPRGMGSSNIPITVQVVDSVDVTPIDTPTSSSNKDSSSKAGKTNAGGKAGAPAEQQQQQPVQAAPQQQAQQQQQQQQPSLQPASVAFAAAGAAAAAAPAGRVVDAAGMAAGANAQRKGAGGREEGGTPAGIASQAPPASNNIMSSSGLNSSATTSPGAPRASVQDQQPPTKAARSVESTAATTSSGNKGGAGTLTATPVSDTISRPSTATNSSRESTSSSSGSSRSAASSNAGTMAGSPTNSPSTSRNSSSSGSPYTVVTGTPPPGYEGGSTSAATEERPESVTILASFEDL